MTRLQCTKALFSLLLFPFLAQAQEIAPGVSLPSKGSIVALDTVEGHPQIVPLHASEVKLNLHTGSNFARGLIYNGPHNSVEIEGPKSKFSLATNRPAFFIRLSDDEADSQRNGLTLVRLMPDKDKRVVMELSANIFGRARKRYVDAVAVTKTDVDGANWLKIVPDQALSAGDYALLYLPKDEATFPMSVYDFSVPATSTSQK